MPFSGEGFYKLPFGGRHFFGNGPFGEFPHFFNGIHVSWILWPRQNSVILSAKNAVTLLALWQRTESCIQMYSTSSGNHSLTCGNTWVSNTRLYWSCFIVPLTVYRRPMTLTEMTDQTVSLTGCLTPSTMQSVWNRWPGRRHTKELLSTKIWKVDSSERHTCKLTEWIVENSRKVIE